MQNFAAKCQAVEWKVWFRVHLATSDFWTALSFSSAASWSSQLPAGGWRRRLLVALLEPCLLLGRSVCFILQMFFWIMDINWIFASASSVSYPRSLCYWRAAGSLLLFSPRPFLTNRKAEVVGFRLTQVSSPALPFAAVWRWTSGCTSLGKMGNQTPAWWGCCAD